MERILNNQVNQEAVITKSEEEMQRKVANVKYMGEKKGPRTTKRPFTDL